jgi:D-tyrosyl-tRNA(Tyr) deacylase
MRIVLQRVRLGRVTVGDHSIAAIGQGVVLLVGVNLNDTQDQARLLAEKVANLRIFEDGMGKMNLSLLDVRGEALVVSQFTLYADVRKGRRPSFTDAAPAEVASPLVEAFAECLAGLGVPTQTGQFGAHMLVQIENDGPVTIMLDAEGEQGH